MNWPLLVFVAVLGLLLLNNYLSWRGKERRKAAKWWAKHGGCGSCGDK